MVARGKLAWQTSAHEQHFFANLVRWRLRYTPEGERELASLRLFALVAVIGAQQDTYLAARSANTHMPGSHCGPDLFLRGVSVCSLSQTDHLWFGHLQIPTPLRMLTHMTVVSPMCDRFSTDAWRRRWSTARFGSTSRVLAKHMLKYHSISV